VIRKVATMVYQPYQWH